MHRCSSCGQVVRSKRDELEANVFVATAMTVVVWGMMLFSAEWTTAWWEARTQLVLIFACIPAVAAYFWWRYLQARKHGAPRA